MHKEKPPAGGPAAESMDLESQGKIRDTATAPPAQQFPRQQSEPLADPITAAGRRLLAESQAAVPTTSVGAVEAPLSETEAAELAEAEAVIERGRETFIEVGSALLRIRDGRLYRATHPTFEAYLRERWEMSRGHAYRAIDAARVVGVLSPMGDTPANERQARELAPVLRDQDEAAVVEVWRELRATYGDDVTAERVKRLVGARARVLKREREAKERAAALPVPEVSGDVRIEHCDIRNLDVAAGSVDLIFTDLRVVALDNAALLYGGGENDREGVTGFMSALNGMADRLGAAVVLSTHQSKSRADNSLAFASGSTAWVNAARSALELRVAEEDAPPRLIVRKANHAKPGLEIPLEWRDAVLTAADGGAGGTIEAMENRVVERAFLDALDRLAYQGKHVTDAPNSPRYAPKVMRQTLKIKHAKRDLEEAMNALFYSGEIVMGASRMPNRHLVSAIVRATENGSNGVR